MNGNSNYALAALAAAALALVLTAAMASVFAYYPVSLSIQGAAPPIELEAGGNAGQADLSGTIDVTVGANKTSLTVTLHPTYQTTYYKDIARIRNTDTANTYYVWIRVVTPTTPALPSGSTAQLIVKTSAGGTAATVDLTTSGTTGPITLSAGDYLQLDFKFSIPEGVQLSSFQGVTASIEVIYSTQSAEAPP
ncbi:MAG: hypothetical protein DRJ57_03040 [Thermoprotei archaeon]|nr:MAG: hypothetical protein DRJ57_03040 [Thermoprotei archaeon]